MRPRQRSRLRLAFRVRPCEGLIGPEYVAGTAALAFLLGAEVVAATAAVSEAALIYTARLRNMVISLTMIAIEAALAAGLIIAMRRLGWPLMWQATGPAIALALALGFAAVVKANLLARILGARVSGWRWSLIWAARLGSHRRLRGHPPSRMGGGVVRDPRHPCRFRGGTVVHGLRPLGPRTIPDAKKRNRRVVAS